VVTLIACVYAGSVPASAETARSAQSFTDSVGVNTKLGSSQSVYWQNWAMIRARLLELGVSHIRDGSLAAGYPGTISSTVAARYNDLDAHGIKGDLMVGDEQSLSDGAPTTVAQRLAWIKANVADFTIAIEGSNEYSTLGGNASRVAALRAMQCDIYQRVKADPVLAPKLVIGPSSGDFYEDRIWYGQVGDLSACLDRGSIHPYPGSDPPQRRLSRDLGVAFDWAKTTYGTKPLWATETGYWTNSPDGSAVSETAAGIYIPRTFMEYFRRGIERTEAYELVDLQPGSNQVLNNYGLLHYDGTPKPAFTALKNLLAIVKDTAPASGSLNFSIACQTNCKYGDPTVYPTQDGPIRHVLLRQSSGAYVLAVWSESQVWDPTTRTDTPKPAQGFRLTLDDAPAKVEIFDPATGTAPISTDTSGSKTLDTVAPDRLRLIRITPGAASSAVAMSFEGESASVNPASAGQVQGDASASGGQRLALSTYASASRSVTTASAAARVVVRARGDQCAEASGTSAPTMTLKVDGSTAGSKAVTASSWTDYAFAASVPAGSHTVSVSYDNDYESAACNRNLYIDKVTLDSPPSPVEAEGMSGSSGIVQSDASASGGLRLFLSTYTTGSKTFTTSTAASQLIVRAKGDQCKEVSGTSAPSMTLTVDGTTVGTRSVTSSTWADHAFTYTLPPGQHTIAISYVNDYENAACNRGLYLDRVSFG
jgi:Ca-dependent carbohydrate-binding module xylan-binding